MIYFLEGGKKENIKVDYRRIDNVNALIKLSNSLKTFPQFEEELKELQNALGDKLLQYKNEIYFFKFLKLN